MVVPLAQVYPKGWLKGGAWAAVAALSVKDKDLAGCVETVVVVGRDEEGLSGMTLDLEEERGGETRCFRKERNCCHVSHSNPVEVTRMSHLASLRNDLAWPSRVLLAVHPGNTLACTPVFILFTPISLRTPTQIPILLVGAKKDENWWKIRQGGRSFRLRLGRVSVLQFNSIVSGYILN